MSIVAMRRATLVGRDADASALLDALQDLGTLHVLPLQLEGRAPPSKPPPPSTFEEEQRALRILQAIGPRRAALRYAVDFDARQVIRRVLELDEQLDARTFERDHLEQRIAAFEPWGEFAFPPLEALAGYRLWFYEVPTWRLGQLLAEEPGRPPLQIVARDQRIAYVVAISRTEPEDMPVERVHLGARPLSTLRRKRESLISEIEDLEAELAGLTRYRWLLSRHHAALRDTADRQLVARRALTDGTLFAVQGWVPVPALPAVEALAEARGVALLVEAPGPEDDVPVLLHNPEGLAGGQEVVSFYSLPGYRTLDPSIPLFFSLSLFFGMIVSDAGYALLLTAGLAIGWRPLGRSVRGRRLRWLGLGIVVCAIVYGALVGSWFGLPPPPGVLADVQVLSLDDNPTLMTLAVALGLFHLVLANVLAAWSRRGHPSLLASLGWATALIGGGVLGLETAGYTLRGSAELGVALLGLGGALVLGFSGARSWWPESPGALLRQLRDGVMGLGSVTRAFGDVLSYLRLFALGLASASLATTFNQLASDVAGQVPGLGLLLAGLVLLAGHGINLALAVLGGVVHGLRLNVLEFQNWCVPEEGRPFRAFRRTAASPEETWNPS